MRSLVLPSRQFQALFLFWLPVAYLICLPTLTVCRLPLTPPALRLFYHLSAACLDPCLLSVYDSALLRYPWRCYQICACLTCCTSNKAAYGSQRHWLLVTLLHPPQRQPTIVGIAAYKLHLNKAGSENKQCYQQAQFILNELPPENKIFSAFSAKCIHYVFITFFFSRTIHCASLCSVLSQCHMAGHLGN